MSYKATLRNARKSFWSSKNGRLIMFSHGSPHLAYETGEFHHPLGIAVIYREKGITRIDYIRNGRTEYLTWDRLLGNRAITRLAREALEGAVVQS